jgi:4-hydroxybenzoate polyprenyltransferase
MAATRSSDRTERRSPLELAALIVGATFLLVGVLGFIPGVTQNYDAMEVAGHESGAELLGIFQVSILHNIVHLAIGVIGLVAAATWEGARLYLVGGGAIYLALAIYGWIVERTSDANFVPMNNADNVLHVLLGAGMILLGVVLGRGYVRDRVVTGEPRI